MKTHKGTAKRVKVTGRGKLMVRTAVPKRLKRKRSRMYGLRRNSEAHQTTRRALRKNLRGVVRVARERPPPGPETCREPATESRPAPATARCWRATRATAASGRTNYKVAHESMMHALRYSTNDRRRRGANFRKLWIIRINAAARQHGLSYSRLINGLGPGRYRNRPVRCSPTSPSASPRPSPR